MSKHIGTVYSAERNERSPQADVAASRAGVEVAIFEPAIIRPDQEAHPVTFRPADARTFAALLVRGADESERMNGIKSTLIGNAGGFFVFAESAGVRLAPQEPRDKHDPDTARELSILLAKASDAVERMRREGGTS